MPNKDSLPEFRELWAFAEKAIPLILRGNGGAEKKKTLHTRVEADFARTRGAWPRELDAIDGCGTRRATNAVAWALSRLASGRIIEPCTRSDLVRLRAYEHTAHAASPQRLERNAAIEEHVRKRAAEAVGRASRRNLPFDERFIEDSVRAVREAKYRCAVSGHEFDIDYRTLGAGGTHYAPSPDRINPQLGYVRGNVQWILWCLNRGKGEMPAEKFFGIFRSADAIEGVAPRIERAEPPSGSDREPRAYTRQQTAAFKAHITMLRRKLVNLDGPGREAALRKLTSYEARLAEALTLPK